MYQIKDRTQYSVAPYVGFSAVQQIRNVLRCLEIKISLQAFLPRSIIVPSIAVVQRSV
jgi:hypothetical protein